MTLDTTKHPIQETAQNPSFMRRLSLLALCCALLSINPGISSAQIAGEADLPYINSFSRPGQPTITVYVWGNVGRTGIWQIERGTDLIEFLSAVQVPGVGQDQINVRRRFTLRIYRGGTQDRHEIYSEEIERILADGVEYPQLQRGDILFLELRQRRRIFSFQFISTLVGTVSSVFLLYLRLSQGR